MPAKDVLLIPDSRARQAQAQANRLLEQHIKHLTTIQRRATKEKKGDIDALIALITQLNRSITQVVRLHHQISQNPAGPAEVATVLARYIDLDGDTGQKQETP